MRTVSALCAIAILAGTSSAQTLEYVGDSTAMDRFNRPDGLGSRSFFATDVPFEAIEVEVTQTGQYTILDDQTNFGARWDGYLLLYEGIFDPRTPLTGLIALNDDYRGSLLPGTGIGYSGVEDVQLRAGTSYFIVTTGYENDDEGPYQVHAFGDGGIRVFRCAGDMNGDGEVDIFDFLEFQNLFDAGDLAADCDEDGSLSLFDFLCFQNDFILGCE